MGGKNGTPAERFQTKFKIDRQTGCWLWGAVLNAHGYGQFYYPPRNMVGAHVVSWEIHRGSRKGLHVLHTCDNPGCVNPEHLYLGTHRDNMRDRDSRGRQYDRSGSKNGRSKLTEKIVAKIRKDKRWQRFVARDYGVGVSTIQKIRNRETWKHVP